MGQSIHQPPPAQEGEPVSAHSVDSAGGMAVSLESASRRAFALWSQVYDHQPNPLLALERRRLARLLPAARGLDVLDAGCGPGRWLAHLAAQSPRSLVGVDACPEMLARAAAKAIPNADLRLADCLALPLPDASIDLALVSFVLGNLHDLAGFARELARVARPGAHAFVSDMHPETASLRNWKQSFRAGGEVVEIEARLRPLERIASIFCAHGWAASLLLEPRFGRPERRILQDCGKLEIFHSSSALPAIYILRLRKMEDPRPGPLLAEANQMAEPETRAGENRGAPSPRPSDSIFRDGADRSCEPGAGFSSRKTRSNGFSKVHSIPENAINAAELESAELAPRLTEMPILVLNVHSRCNCRCLMCDIWKRETSAEVKAERLERHQDSLRRLGVRHIVLTGGEPLLHSDLSSLCRFLRRREIRLTLLSTGLLLRKRAEEVAFFFDDAIVSIDGPAEIHDAIRRVPGAFQLIRNGIAALRLHRADMRIAGRSTVQKANHLHLRATVAAAKTLGLDSISFLAADLTSSAFNRPLPWPLERQSGIALDPGEADALEEEIERLIDRHAEDIRSGYIAESAAKLRRIARHFRAHLGQLAPESPPCNAPWVSAVVETDGAVRPCFFHPAFGNIDAQSLEEAVNGEPAQSFRKSLRIADNPICRRCVCSLRYPVRPSDHEAESLGTTRATS